MENEKIDQATRQLIRSSSRAYLATELNKENKKKMISDNKIYLPYVTFVMVAFDYDCSPLLLLSDLSEHTKNLKNNNIISLLFCEEQRNEEIFLLHEGTKVEILDSLKGWEKIRLANGSEGWVVEKKIKSL